MQNKNQPLSTTVLISNFELCFVDIPKNKGHQTLTGYFKSSCPNAETSTLFFPNDLMVELLQFLRKRNSNFVQKIENSLKKESCANIYAINENLILNEVVFMAKVGDRYQICDSQMTVDYCDYFIESLIPIYQKEPS